MLLLSKFPKSEFVQRLRGTGAVGGPCMRLLVNRVRFSRRFSTFGIFVKHLARNLFSLVLGISTGYFFVTLVLQPVSAYAAPAMVAGAAGSMASAPRIEREASFGHAGPAAMVAGLRLNGPIAGDRLVPNDGPAVRIPGNVLDALRQATLESPGKSTADEAKPLAITIVLKRSDPKGFKRYLHDVYDSRSPALPSFSHTTPGLRPLRSIAGGLWVGFALP